MFIANSIPNFWDVPVACTHNVVPLKTVQFRSVVKLCSSHEIHLKCEALNVVLQELLENGVVQLTVLHFRNVVPVLYYIPAIGRFCIWRC